MGAHNTDHENNKIKQDHWKDLIWLLLAEGRTSAARSPMANLHLHRSVQYLSLKISFNLQHCFCFCVSSRVCFVATTLPIPEKNGLINFEGCKVFNSVYFLLQFNQD